MGSLTFEIRSQWKAVCLFVLAGLGLGWASAAVNAPSLPRDSSVRTQIVSFNPASTVVRVPVAISPAQPTHFSEWQKLEIRNARLEALVQALRARQGQSAPQGQIR